MGFRKLWTVCAILLLIAVLAGTNPTSSARAQGIIQARLLSPSTPGLSSSSLLRAVAAVKDSTDVTETNGTFQTSLYRGALFRLQGLPLDRTLWISFLNAEGMAIKTIAARIDAERNPLDLSLDLSETGNRPGSINGTFTASGQVSHSLSLNRHVYTAGDTLKIRYRVENLGQSPVVFNFPSAQRYDFVLQQEDAPLWQWSEGRMFAQMIGSLELVSGGGVTYEAELALGSLDLAADRGYTLKGRMPVFPSDTGERPPEVELGFVISSVPSIQFDLQVGSSITVDGVYDDALMFTAESAIDPLQGTVEVLARSENSVASIPGYRFIQAIDLLPEVALASTLTLLRVQIPYEESRLRALNVREENIRMFLVGREGDVPQPITSKVNRADDRVIGDVEGFGTLGLFAVPGTGLIGDFDADGEVGFKDFVSFARGFGKRAGDLDFQPELDLDGDSEVGFKDFVVFVAHYGETLPK